MIHPIAFLLAIVAALFGEIVALLAVRDAYNTRKAAKRTLRNLDAANNWASAQEIYIKCVEDELYQTKCALGAVPGEKAYDAAKRRLAEEHS
jgi:hypothetical protein